MQIDVRTFYKKRLALYPSRFKERLGESMEQTFDDLHKERKQQPGYCVFLASMFAETAIGIVQEHLVLLTERDIMKTILANPTSAAIASFILALPLGFTYVVLMFEIEPLARLLNELFTVEGQSGEINTLGRIVIFGGLLVLPIAFALNLQPILKRKGQEQKRSLYALNLIVGAALLLLFLFTWGGLILEQIYCLQGIRCD